MEPRASPASLLAALRTCWVSEQYVVVNTVFAIEAEAVDRRERPH